MGVDFTVIQAVRQHFGDDRLEDYDYPREREEWKEAPFVGYAKVYSFDCPNVDPEQMAVLQLESVGLSAHEWKFRWGDVSYERHRNILMINDKDVPGGLTPSGDLFWRSHSLVVPAGVLKDQNTLYVESREIPQSRKPLTRDDFIIDNVVVFYKTLGRGGAGGEIPPIEPVMG